MIKIGEYNKLKVVRKAEFGVFLDAQTRFTSDDILVPNNGIVTENIEIGDELEVFVYRDSFDRMIATEKKPKAIVGELAVLEVKEKKENIGAFLDIGLERDVLVPHKEQEYELEIGKSYLVYLYVDKTGRLAATTNVDKYLDYMEEPEMHKEVSGIVYGYQTNGSLAVAIDNEFRAAVLTREFFTEVKPGEVITGIINRVYEDGMITLRLRAKKLDEKTKLEDEILAYLKKNDGQMKLWDKSSPEDIKAVFKCSKKYFKMALGGLFKAKLITIDENGTKLV
ncbi:MAG: CvfB family protein [Sarcina sp.]